MRPRVASIQRKTKEVRIQGRLNLDGAGRSSVKTGMPFLDHMLELFAKHGLFDLDLRARGDLQIDVHHTNEDLGLSLGEAFKKALGDKKGLHRMGSAFVPMDETLARVRSVVDLSGRPFLGWNWPKTGLRQSAFRRKAKETVRLPAYDLQDAKHFLESFVTKAEVTLHVDVLKSGEDIHHLLESVFKALGRSLKEAVRRDPRVKGVPSTKGKL